VTGDLPNDTNLRVVRDRSRDVLELAREISERAQAACRHAAEVLSASADLAERHAQRAETRGDLRRAEDEREIARRLRARLERLSDRSAWRS
jgi:hypothetical protein